jgi:hypothetical protein
MANRFRNNKIYMGDHQFDNRKEREQYEDHGFVFHGFDRHYLRNNYKRIGEMAETKFAAILLNIIGIPLCFLSFWQNLDNVKSAVLFMCALCFILIRMYFFVIWAKQKTERRRLENERYADENRKLKEL